MAASPSPLSLADDTAVLTTHFGDADWIRLLWDRVHESFPELPDGHFYVIDQNRTRTSVAELRSLLPAARVLRFPASSPHMETTGHDHAHVLNLAVREIDHDYVLVFDSDAHPVSERVRPLLLPLIAEHDAVLAARFATGPESHPCFMAFGPRVPRERLFFDEGQLEIGIDTGRRTYSQLAALDLDVHLIRPEPAFCGVWGTFFLERTIYHHGSGSFQHSDNPRLTNQSETWNRRQRLVRRHVFAHSYELSLTERSLLAASRALASGRRRAIATAASVRRS